MYILKMLAQNSLVLFISKKLMDVLTLKFMVLCHYRFTCNCKRNTESLSLYVYIYNLRYIYAYIYMLDFTQFLSVTTSCNNMKWYHKWDTNIDVCKIQNITTKNPVTVLLLHELSWFLLSSLTSNLSSISSCDFCDVTQHSTFHFLYFSLSIILWVHSIPVFISHSFSLRSSAPLCGCITICLYIFVLKDK
jgi:hypothetical protein